MKERILKAVRKIALVGATVCIPVLWLPQAALASGALTSFNMTNNLQGTVVITSYPTNHFNPTNGFPQQTGNGIYIGNFRSFNFNVQGFLVNTGAAATATFTLIGANSGGSPASVLGTNLLSVNQTVLTDIDWETVMPATNTAALLGTPVIFTMPGFTTNWFNWHTNFDISWSKLAGANWVGIYSISNNLATTCQLTNSAAYINTKIIPVGLIGN